MFGECVGGGVTSTPRQRQWAQYKDDDPFPRRFKPIICMENVLNVGGPVFTSIYLKVFGAG